MTEPVPNNQEPTPEKLLIDDLSNFPFHAAYLVYSELFDNARGADAKRDLNLNIDELGLTRLPLKCSTGTLLDTAEVKFLTDDMTVSPCRRKEKETGA